MPACASVVAIARNGLWPKIVSSRSCSPLPVMNTTAGTRCAGDAPSGNRKVPASLFPLGPSIKISFTASLASCLATATSTPCPPLAIENPRQESDTKKAKLEIFISSVYEMLCGGISKPSRVNTQRDVAVAARQAKRGASVQSPSMS